MQVSLLNGSTNDPISQVNKHNMVSKKYHHIETSPVINWFNKQGFEVFKTQISRTRIPENQGYQTHVVRLRNEAFFKESFGGFLGSLVPEILISNNHLGKQALRLELGVFRVVCANGLVCSLGHLNRISIRHTAGYEWKLEEALKVISNSAVPLGSFIASMQNRVLTMEEQRDLAIKLASVRYKNDNINTLNISDLLKPLREEDASADAFTVFNRVQEKLISGHVMATRLNSKGQERVIPRRAVKSPIRDISLNKDMWKVLQGVAA